MHMFLVKLVTYFTLLLTLPSSLYSCHPFHITLLKSISSHLPPCVNVLMSSSSYFTWLTNYAFLCHPLCVILPHFPLSTSLSSCYCLHITSHSLLFLITSSSSCHPPHLIFLTSPSTHHLHYSTFLMSPSSPHLPHITLHTSSSLLYLPHITLHMSSLPYPPRVTLPCHSPHVTLLMLLFSQQP